jgi:four helix bundle protein
MKLGLRVYELTDSFPRKEMFGLRSQMTRAAVSVPSNIAEGKGRQTDKEFRQFLFHARGSLMELETQIEFARELKYLKPEDAASLLKECTQLAGGLAGLINAISGKSASAGA